MIGKSEYSIFLEKNFFSVSEIFLLIFRKKIFLFSDPEIYEFQKKIIVEHF